MGNLNGCPFSFICLNKKEMKQSFKDLNIKDKLAIVSACIAFTAGWALTICAAFVPLLLSEQGILWILGQALIYSASVFGLGMYFKSESTQMKNDMQRYFDKQERLQEKRLNLKRGIDEGELPNEE